MVVESESVSVPSENAMRNKGSEQVLVRWSTVVLLFFFCESEFKEAVQRHEIF